MTVLAIALAVLLIIAVFDDVRTHRRLARLAIESRDAIDKAESAEFRANVRAQSAYAEVNRLTADLAATRAARQVMAKRRAP